MIATFKEAGVKGRLRLLVEAESLFNDGTVAVLFGVALAATVGAAAHGASVGAAQRFRFSAWRRVSSSPSRAEYLRRARRRRGAAAGGAHRRSSDRNHFHHRRGLRLVFAGRTFSFSGVLATLTAGVLIGNTGSLGAITDQGREAVESFWEYVGFVANSLIFLLIGLRLGVEKLSAVWLPALITIVFVTLGRAVAVYACCALFGALEQARFAQSSARFVLGRLARRAGFGAGAGLARRRAAARRDYFGRLCRRRIFGHRARLDDDAAVAQAGRNRAAPQYAADPR